MEEIPIEAFLTNASPEAEPAALGMGGDRLRALDRYFAEQVEKKALQGAAYIASRRGRVVASNAFGNRTCKEGSGPLTLDVTGDIFELTVVFTSAVVLRLADEGRLSLSSRAASYIPALDHPYYRDITIRHLLTCTAGINPVQGMPYELPFFDWHSTFKDDWLSTLLSFPLANKPGERHVWGTACYAVLGVIVEQATGKRIEDCIREMILQPLGMENTIFILPPEKMDRTTYAFDWQEWGMNSGGDTRVPHAHRGLYSTLQDLHTFGLMLLNGGEWNGVRILSRGAVELMTTNGLQGIQAWARGGTEETAVFAMGWHVANGENEPLTPGVFWQGNSMCGLYVDPKEEIVYTFFTPNPTWTMIETHFAPRAILWSAVPPERPAASAIDGLSGVADGLHARFAEMASRGQIQGAAFLMAAGDGPAHTDAAGSRTRQASSTPLAAGDLFLVSSLNKLLTMTAVMQLVEDCKLSLVQPAKDWIPEFDTDVHRDIRIGHLLAHTSGIAPEPGLLGEPNPNGWWEYRFLFEGNWIKAALAGMPFGKPGEKVLYSTAGYLLLGEIVSRAVGQPYERYVERRILEPLGMQDTFFTVPQDRMSGVASSDEWQELLLGMNRDGAGNPPRSGSGFYTTLEDLRKLGLMLLDGGAGTDGRRIVGKASVDFLARRRFMDVPGLLWADAGEEHFPYGAAEYPAALAFPMPYYQDLGIGAMLILEPASRFVAAVAIPSSVDWSPEPLQYAKNLIKGGIRA